MVTTNACQALNIALNNVIGGNFPRIPNIGMLYALLESSRMGGVLPDPAQGLNEGFVPRDVDGKPIVKVSHYQPSTTASRTTKSCDADPISPVKSDFKITMYREHGFLVGMEELSALCGDAAAVINGGVATDGVTFNVANTLVLEETRKKALAIIYRLLADINADVLTKTALNFGTNITTGLTTAKAVTLYKADGSIDEDAYAEILEDLSDNQLLQNPIVIGGRRFSKYAQKMKWSSLANSGVDFDRVRASDPMLFFKDRVADTILGANNIAVIAPGTAKLVTFNKYKGVFAGTHANSQLGTLILKEFGNDLRFNLKVTADDCPDETFKFIISLEFDVYTPKNIYAAGDPHAGVNGLLRYSVA